MTERQEPAAEAGCPAIKPTIGMVNAFFGALPALRSTPDVRADVRAGLAAVLAIVERDYDVLPKPQGARAITNPCLCGADLGPPWDSIPHQRGSRGCRSAS